MPLVDDIREIAANSKLRRYAWKDRGRAPLGYIEGMALAYAKSVQDLAAGSAVQATMTGPLGLPEKDALKWYEPELAATGASTATAIDRLRCLFALLLGLGMRESSGRHCEGRDMSANNVDALTAEAGLFQTSYNSVVASPLLGQLFTAYQGKSDLRDVFSEGVTCGLGSWQDYGTGPGKTFQTLSKTCPLFAVEYAAVLLRHMRKHWGPINAKRAEVIPEAFEMLRAVEAAVAASAGGAIVVAAAPAGASLQVRKLIDVATAEWEFFGRSTRSLSNDWHVAGDEADEPYSSRVGKYWRSVGDLTATGNTPQPWSAAFISWVFQNAGVAPADFRPSDSHAHYIDWIMRNPGGLTLQQPTRVLQPGDLIWNTREPGVKTYAQALNALQAGNFFPSHCDLVVRVGPGWCESIGGNVSNLDPGGSVTKSTWALNAGVLADPRKTWIGVIVNGL